MTPRLTREFKSQAIDFILNTSNQLILANFDENDKTRKTINIEDTNTTGIQITRNCFADAPYYEDYYVSFEVIIQNQKVYSQFYLEWKNNDMTTKELIPANRYWNPITGICSNRKITIRKCNPKSTKKAKPVSTILSDPIAYTSSSSISEGTV